MDILNPLKYIWHKIMESIKYEALKVKIEELEPPPVILTVYKQGYENLTHHRLIGARVIDKIYIEELSKSIKQDGLLHPMYVQKREDNKYRIISGSCRYLALKQTEIKEVEVRALEINDVEAKAMLIKFNFNQRPLNEIEEGWVIKEIIEKDKLSYRELEKLIGRDKNWIYRRLKLVNSLAEEVQLDVIMKLITPKMAVEISSVPPVGQIELASIIKQRRISYDEIRQLISVYRDENLSAELRESILSDPSGCARKLKRGEPIEKSPGLSALSTNIKNKLKIISSSIKDLCINIVISELDKRCANSELEIIAPYIEDTIKCLELLYKDLKKLKDKI